MIKNFPSSNDYLIVGEDCVITAVLKLSAIYTRYQNESSKKDIPGISIEDIWSYNSLNINSSLILLHQGLEAFMKSEVCKKSPLLLIDEPYNNWPVSPESKSKDFNSFYQIGGSNLYTVFYAIFSRNRKLTTAIFNLLEKVRITRNETIHSRPNQKIDTKTIVSWCLDCLDLFYNDNNSLMRIREKFKSDPLIRYDNDLSFLFSEVIVFLEKTIGKKRLSKYIGIDLKSRRYHCPNCSSVLAVPENHHKFSFLAPNNPDSTTIKCLICDIVFNVSREDCQQDGCLGNVISTRPNEKLCLTCFKYSINHG